MKSERGLVLFGTRPEAIKILTVVQAIRRTRGVDAVHVCCSGQHKDLVEDTRQSIKLDIDVNFQLMAAGQTPADITQKVLARTTQEITDINPSWILVHGDTATTLGGGSGRILCPSTRYSFRGRPSYIQQKFTLA